MTAQQTVPKYINPHVFPVCVIDGVGGKTQIVGGEVVQGTQFRPLVDPRRGLVPYYGDRPVGKMVRIRPNQQQIQQMEVTQPSNIQFAPEDLPAGVTPHVQESIDIIDTGNSGVYLEKTAFQWKETYQKNPQEIMNLNRGKLMGLCKFVGVDPQEGNTSQILSSLTQYLGQDSRQAQETVAQGIQESEESRNDNKKNKKK